MLDDNGIMNITLKDCSEIDEYDIVDLNLVLKHLANKQPTFKISDTRADWKISKAANLKSKEEDLTSNTQARAIIISKNIKSTLLSFIHSFMKTNYPQKIFYTKDSAYQWILEQKRIYEANQKK
ncbi:MAG: hypothetical protein IPM51_00985 [Sphingobacteriaceae bacterium]|nr:hypothetical protein [Sphingobacteriaceae bacterium]